MNYRLVCKLLAVVALLIGVMMTFSLPWAFPALGTRTDCPAEQFEYTGFFGLAVSMALCFLVAGALARVGRGSRGQLYRKEAMAVVGLSWAMATVLGGLPYELGNVYRASAVRLFSPQEPPMIRGKPAPLLSAEQYPVVAALAEAGARGLPPQQLAQRSGRDDAAEILEALRGQHPAWDDVLLAPGEVSAPADRAAHWRMRWVRMNVVDAMFESQSGFSTTGATVLADLEDPHLVPHCLLFWRSSTHFLGGLGIIVLFVAILGQGSAGKALMRAEMPGPSKEGGQPRMQQAAWIFAAIYCGLTAVEAVLLKLLGLSWFDALCHAFGTMATGGFSTYNASVGHFDNPWVDAVVIVFMILAGTNFTLLYALLLWQPRKLLGDVEWRAYISILLAVSFAVVVFGMAYHDFNPRDPAGAQAAPLSAGGELANGLRYGVFQVVSIMTTTGFCTADFDGWNSFARGALLLLMFVGGCAGSTGGGLKVIRHVLLLKILWLELERAFHPTVVRPLRIGGQVAEDPMLRHQILTYFALILVIFAFSWLFVLTLEPDRTWGTAPEHTEHKLIDSASAVAATLNNIGPGLGIVGATQNYTHFTWPTKLLFTLLMMLGRLELFAILVLFSPAFWRSR